MTVYIIDPERTDGEYTTTMCHKDKDCHMLDDTPEEVLVEFESRVEVRNTEGFTDVPKSCSYCT